MPSFVEGVANLIVASGIGTGLYSTSGVSVQVSERRDLGTSGVILLQETGGAAFPHDAKEQQGFQVLIDWTTISGARATARQVFDLLHESTLLTVSAGGEEFSALWVRATAMPQAIPIGPGAGEAARHQFSVNFDALIVKEF